MKLINSTDLEFESVNEEWREYDYLVDGTIVTIRVENVRWLNVHPAHGAHRLLDAEGVSHYMPGNWMPRVGLRWKAAVGEPHFSYTLAPTRNEYSAVGEPDSGGDTDRGEAAMGSFTMGLGELLDMLEDACPGCEDCMTPVEETQEDPVFKMPPEVVELIESIRNDEVFTTEQLEFAAKFFRGLEDQITRGEA